MMDAPPLGGVGRGTIRSDFTRPRFSADDGAMYGVDLDFSRKYLGQDGGKWKRRGGRVSFAQNLNEPTIGDDYGRDFGKRGEISERTGGFGGPGDYGARSGEARRFDLDTELRAVSAASGDSSDEEMVQSGRHKSKRGQRRSFYVGRYSERGNANPRNLSRRFDSKGECTGDSAEEQVDRPWRQFAPEGNRFQRRRKSDYPQEVKGYRGGRHEHGPTLKTCFNCGEEGHMRRDCPEPITDRGRSEHQRGPPRKPKKCYNCNEEGHFSRACPQKIGSEFAGAILSESEVNTEAEELSRDTPAAGIAPSVPFADDCFEKTLDETTNVTEGHNAEQDANPPNGHSTTGMCGIGDSSLTYAFLLAEKPSKLFVLLNLFKTIDKFKTGAHCECDFFVKCSCKPKVVIFVNRETTTECVRIFLESVGLPVVSIHRGMPEAERTRNLNSFSWSRSSIIVLMATEAAACRDDTKNIDWVINYDLPMNQAEFKSRVDECRGEGKPLTVTSLYDKWTDASLAEGLAGVLRDSGQTVPDWLQKGEAPMSE